MKGWTPEQIVLVLSFICATVLPAVAAFINSIRAKRDATSAKNTACDAKTEAAVAKNATVINGERITNVSNHAVSIDGKVSDLAAQIPPKDQP